MLCKFSEGAVKIPRDAALPGLSLATSLPAGIKVNPYRAGTKLTRFN